MLKNAYGLSHKNRNNHDMKWMLEETKRNAHIRIIISYKTHTGRPANWAVCSIGITANAHHTMHKWFDSEMIAEQK